MLALVRVVSGAMELDGTSLVIYALELLVVATTIFGFVGTSGVYIEHRGE